MTLGLRLLNAVDITEVNRTFDLSELHYLSKHVPEFMFPAYVAGFSTNEEVAARREELSRKLGM